MEDGPDSPLKIEREAAAQAGHSGAQASAQAVEESSASPSSNRSSTQQPLE